MNQINENNININQINQLNQINPMEIVSEKILQEKISFLEIAEINEAVVESATNFLTPRYEQYVLADQQAREKARELIQKA